MNTFDLAISYTWNLDKDFVRAIEAKLQSAGLKTFVITEENIFDVTSAVNTKKLWFNSYLDRASDVDDDFLPLAQILTKRKCRIFNPYKEVERSIDKATMHLDFITAGIQVPYSIILPPLLKRKEIFISVDDLALLGRPFIIKPCNTTGGGIGVVTGAETLKEVLRERKENIEDKYLIQEKIIPSKIEGKRAWFRSFWAFGKPISVWWDDETHIYDLLSVEEMKRLKLRKLNQIIKKISLITRLDFFSAEIALTDDKKFIVIDYVNDQCDMRFQSNHLDGVPDLIISEIIENLKKSVQRIKSSNS